MTDTEVVVAHLIIPAIKMEDVIKGKKAWAAALCGKRIKNEGDRIAPICRACFFAFVSQNERAAEGS